MKKANIEEIKKIQLNILEQVINFCDKYSLEYRIAYGTLLGAVRHKGYIPWDDDIDIVMPRNSYEVFIDKFNSFSKQFKVLHFQIDRNFPYTFAKVHHPKSIVIENTALNYTNLGINMDIFPIDRLPKHKLNRKVRFFKIRFLKYLLTIKNIRITKTRNRYKNIILLIFKIITGIFPYKFIIRKINSISKRNVSNNSNKSGCILWNYGEKEIFDNSIYSNVRYYSFEGIQCIGPQDYEEYLTKIYGDYKELPPVEKRVSHHDLQAYFR